MPDLLVKVLINAVAVVVAVKLVPGMRFEFGAEPWKLVAVALILALVNSYLRPIVRLLSLPLSLFAIGLVGFVINLALLMLVALVSAELRLGFSIAGWPGGPVTLEVLLTAFLASLVISVVSTVLSLALSQRRLLGMRI